MFGARGDEPDDGPSAESDAPSSPQNETDFREELERRVTAAAERNLEDTATMRETNSPESESNTAVEFASSTTSTTDLNPSEVDRLGVMLDGSSILQHLQTHIQTASQPLTILNPLTGIKELIPYEKEQIIHSAFSSLEESVTNLEAQYNQDLDKSPLLDERDGHLVRFVTELITESESLMYRISLWSQGSSEIPAPAIRRRARERVACKLLLALSTSSPSMDVSEFIPHTYLCRKVVNTSTTDEFRVLYTGLLAASLNSDRDVADYVVHPHPNDAIPVAIPVFLLVKLRERIVPLWRETNEFSEEFKHTLRCLATLCEYQEVLGSVLAHQGPELIIELLKSSNILLQYEGLEMVSHLLVHKKFANVLVDLNGLDTMISIAQHCPYKDFLSGSLSWCFARLTTLTGVMEKLLQNRSKCVRAMITFCIELLNASYSFIRKNALYFLGSALSFPLVVSQFDRQNGLHRLLDCMVHPCEDAADSRYGSLAKYVVSAISQHTRAHVAIAVHQWKLTSGKHRSGGTTTAADPGTSATHKQNGNSQTTPKTDTSKNLTSQPQRQHHKRSLPLHQSLPLDDKSHEDRIALLQPKHRQKSSLHSQLVHRGLRPIRMLLSYRAQDTDKAQEVLDTSATVTASQETKGGVGASASKTTTTGGWWDRYDLNSCDGITWLLRIVRDTIDRGLASSQSFEDAATLALQVLRVVTLHPIMCHRVCAKPIDERDPSLIGIGILLDATYGGNTGASNPYLTVAALEVLSNCCSPDLGDEIVQRDIRRMARRNNALMVLLRLLRYRETPSRADRIQYLSCLTLFGLARDNQVAQVLNSLQVVSTLSRLSRSDPVVVENQKIREKLRKIALELIEIIQGAPRRGGASRHSAVVHAADATHNRLDRAVIVAQTQVSFSQTELLKVIQEHLTIRGLHRTAALLVEEAGIIPHYQTVESVTPLDACKTVEPLNHHLAAGVTTSLQTNKDSVSSLQTNEDSAPSLQTNKDSVSSLQTNEDSASSFQNTIETTSTCQNTKESNNKSTPRSIQFQWPSQPNRNLFANYLKQYSSKGLNATSKNVFKVRTKSRKTDKVKRTKHTQSSGQLVARSEVLNASEIESLTPKQPRTKSSERKNCIARYDVLSDEGQSNGSQVPNLRGKTSARSFHKANSSVKRMTASPGTQHMEPPTKKRNLSKYGSNVLSKMRGKPQRDGTSSQDETSGSKSPRPKGRTIKSIANGRLSPSWASAILEDPFSTATTPDIKVKPISRSSRRFSKSHVSSSLASLVGESQFVDSNKLGTKPVLLRVSSGGSLSHKTHSLRSVRSANVSNNEVFRQIGKHPLSSNPSADTVNQPESTLEALVQDHLREQHRDCPKPICVVPPFSLIHKHKCPDTPAPEAPMNIAARLELSRTQGGWGGRWGKSKTRRLVHSKWRRTKRFQPIVDSAGEESADFTVATFSGSSRSDEELLVGNTDGQLHRYVLDQADALSIQDLHESPITQLATHGNLVLSCSEEIHHAVLWKFENNDELTKMLQFNDCVSIEFSPDGNQMIGMNSGEASKASLYDLVTGTIVKEFQEQITNNYAWSKPCMSPDGKLVLNDGVLWDVRSATSIHKFDKLSMCGQAVFHPSGNHAIINSAIWDLRTYKLLKTTPTLDHAVAKFDKAGDVIYSFRSEFDHEAMQSQIPAHSYQYLSVLDGESFNDIASRDLGSNVVDLSLDRMVHNVAVVMGGSEDDPSISQCLVLEVGRPKPSDDDSDMEDLSSESGDETDSGSSSIEYRFGSESSENGYDSELQNEFSGNSPESYYTDDE